MDIKWYATYLTDSLADIKARYEAQLEANQASLSMHPVGNSLRYN